VTQQAAKNKRKTSNYRNKEASQLALMEPQKVLELKAQASSERWAEKRRM
jgi:hypothetical protein